MNDIEKLLRPGGPSGDGSINWDRELPNVPVKHWDLMRLAEFVPSWLRITGMDYTGTVAEIELRIAKRHAKMLGKIDLESTSRSIVVRCTHKLLGNVFVFRSVAEAQEVMHTSFANKAVSRNIAKYYDVEFFTPEEWNDEVAKEVAK